MSQSNYQASLAHNERVKGLIQADTFKQLTGVPGHLWPLQVL